MGRGGGRAWRVVAVAAASLDAFAVVVYLVVIDGQGDPGITGETVAWAAAMALPGLLCLVAAVTPARVARWALPVAVLPAGGIGLLAIFTIGMLFLLVAVLAVTAAALCWAVPVRRQPPLVSPINSQA